MAYTWSKDLETGYTAIDDQHRELFATVNVLNEANRAGKASSEIFSIIAFLINYANKHFADEEALQIKYNYPDYHRHKMYHNEFKTQVEHLSQKLKQDGATQELINEAILYVADWLLHHIRGDDFAMAAYVQLKDTQQQDAV